MWIQLNHQNQSTPYGVVTYINWQCNDCGMIKKKVGWTPPPAHLHPDQYMPVGIPPAPAPFAVGWFGESSSPSAGDNKSTPGCRCNGCKEKGYS